MFDDEKDDALLGLDVIPDVSDTGRFETRKVNQPLKVHMANSDLQLKQDSSAHQVSAFPVYQSTENKNCRLKLIGILWRQRQS